MIRNACSALFIVLCSCANAAIADQDATEETSGWTGTAGVGPMAFSKYTGGSGNQTWLLPLVSASYDNFINIDPLRANVYLAGSANKKLGVGLAVEPRMGFHASDGTKLVGMATRRNSLEGDLNMDWDADIVMLSISYLTDMTYSSKGNSARLYLYKDLVNNEKWQVGANIGADHMSAKVANYFFGVTSSEATADRPFYQPGSATNGRFRDECLNEHWFLSMRHARNVIEAWRQEYNTERPHSSLGYLTPAQFAERFLTAGSTSVSY